MAETMLVTGAAGFIGSHLVDRLLAMGRSVIGVDLFTDYYDTSIKRSNLDAARHEARFELVEIDLARDDVDELVEGVDVIFHLAGQPGVRASWGAGFDEYLNRNILATQRLLEACKGKTLERFVFSSSSSVYGAAPRFPTCEADLPAPMSPYGVTKLAAEHLCGLYAQAFGVPTIALRYFTVYGPRQRPDMAMHRLVESALQGTRFPLHGDGSQVRDFTYVDDAVAANVVAAEVRSEPGTVLNIGGGAMTALRDVIATIERLTERSIALDHLPIAPGDPARTGADTTRAREILGWAPAVAIDEGLARQVEWQKASRRSSSES